MATTLHANIRAIDLKTDVQKKLACKIKTMPSSPMQIKFIKSLVPENWAIGENHYLSPFIVTDKLGR